MMKEVREEWNSLYYTKARIVRPQVLLVLHARLLRVQNRIRDHGKMPRSPQSKNGIGMELLRLLMN